VTVPTPVLSRAFGPDADVLIENYQFNNVFDCSRAKDELDFRYATTLRTGFELMAAKFGGVWRQSGEEERHSSFARTYEGFLAWWQATTDQLDPHQW
jgi:hypothetical protein